MGFFLTRRLFCEVLALRFSSRRGEKGCDGFQPSRCALRQQGCTARCKLRLLILNMKETKDNSKKQIPLRVSPKLYDALAKWAEDDFRSINGQIEYLLTECVKQRKKNGRPVPHELDEPIELDI